MVNRFVVMFYKYIRVQNRRIGDRGNDLKRTAAIEHTL